MEIQISYLGENMTREYTYSRLRTQPKLQVLARFLDYYQNFFAIFHEIQYFSGHSHRAYSLVRHTSDCVKRGYALYESRLYYKNISRQLCQAVSASALGEVLDRPLS
jgi:hypothetical protein